ncbi:MAG: hypothetical protein DRI24_13320 [Deltaproteobacteria bacterium]|nr:MAG: hypothetical protein DRI24_13320 [Deltaproteobacteria bacterium]
MSAWLCSDKHIFELAKYYVEKCQQYTSRKLTFKAAAQMLYDENCESLAARYGDDYTPIKIPVNYVSTIDNIFVLAKQVDCYSYQACEHDGWDASRAKEICETISSYLLSNHPDYDAAPWGI